MANGRGREERYQGGDQNDLQRRAVKALEDIAQAMTGGTGTNRELLVRIDANLVKILGLLDQTSAIKAEAASLTTELSEGTDALKESVDKAQAAQGGPGSVAKPE